MSLRDLFAWAPSLPVTAEERAWVEGAFERLIVLFGADTLRAVKVIAPKDDHFPEWDGTPECVPPLLARVCGYMGADPTGVNCEIIEDDLDHLQRAVPIFQHTGSRAAGTYRAADEAQVVSVRESLLPYPIVLIATLAHEVAHVRLLGEARITRDEPDMEPLTDLATVFFGFGIFNANAAVRFEQTKRGWSTNRLGYLSQPLWSYALAEFARLRGEEKPDWARFLGPDIAEYFKRSQAVLRREAIRGAG